MSAAPSDVKLDLGTAPVVAPVAAPAPVAAAAAGEDTLPALGALQLKPHNSVQTVDGVFVGPGGAGAAAPTAGGARPKSMVKGYSSHDSSLDNTGPSAARFSAVTGVGLGLGAGGPPPAASSGAATATGMPVHAPLTRIDSGLPALGSAGPVAASSGTALVAGGVHPHPMHPVHANSDVGHLTATNQPAPLATSAAATPGATAGANAKPRGLAAHSSFTAGTDSRAVEMIRVGGSAQPAAAGAGGATDGKVKGLGRQRTSSNAGSLVRRAPSSKIGASISILTPFELVAKGLKGRSNSSADARPPIVGPDGKVQPAPADAAVKPVKLPGDKQVRTLPSGTSMKQVRDAALAKTDEDKKHAESHGHELATQHGSNLETGLTSAQVAEKLAKDGKNELDKEPPEPMWKLFLMQFTDLLVAMLIVAAIIAAALGEYASSVVIIIIVMANAILGLTQESRAGAALEALAALHSPKAEVIRDGKNVTVESADLVVGDVILLALGSTIPADIRLVYAEQFAANEMPLTGESMPVRKTANVARSATASPGGLGAVDEKGAPAAAVHDDDDDDKEKKEEKPAAGNDKEAAEKKQKEEMRKKIALTEKNCVYMGCQVVEGNGKGIVVKTGMQTKMGEIAKLLEIDEDEGTPLQNKLRGLGKVLGLASIFLSATVFIVGMSTGRGVDTSEDALAPWLQMLLITVSLVVAAVPEGLPACVTITLAMGMQKMSEKKAQIRNLRSVETLGSASVICTDKTGTLTCGKMTLVQLWTPRAISRVRFTGVGYDPNGKLLPVDIKEEKGNEAAVAAATANWERAGNPQNMALFIAALDSQAEIFKDEKGEWDCKGNMSECPIVVATKKAGKELKDLHAQYPKVHANPFNSGRKMSSTVRDTTNGDDHYFHGVANIASVKGAPDRVLAKCTRMVADGAAPGTFAVRAISPADMEVIQTANRQAGEQAFRVLAVAYKPLPKAITKDQMTADALEKDLVFLGLLFIIDPERPEVADVIRRASFAGIRTVMITGDHVITAKAIAENVAILPRGSPLDKAADCEILRGFGTEIIRIEKAIKDLKKSSEADKDTKLNALNADLEKNQLEVDRITVYCDVYARAQPKDKITIVRSLQRQGHVCSMTGDGVNDAPALRRADIGVAMGKTGTEVARAAAAMVLTDDNFVSIVLAIEEGRTIYNNIQKFVFYLLSTNVSEVLLILVGVLAGYPSPLEPIQILWLNLATDGAPAIALAIELPNPGLMEEGPRNKSDPILEPLLLIGICIQNLVMTGCCVFVYILGLYWNTGAWQLTQSEYSEIPENLHAVHKARTMCIIYIVFAELLRAYSSRSLRHSIFTIGWFTNRWMQIGVFLAVAFTILFALTPGLQDVFGMKDLEGKEWGFVIGFSFTPLLTDEITKFFYRLTGFGIRPAAKLVGVAGREAAARAATKAAAGGATNGDEKSNVTIVANAPLLPKN